MRKHRCVVVLVVAFFGSWCGEGRADDLVQVANVARTYTGVARITNSSFQTIASVLNASETGLGDIGFMPECHVLKPK